MKNSLNIQDKASPFTLKRKIFYGWVIVAVGAVTQFFQGVSTQGLATYLGLLQAEFGWTNAVLAGARSVTQIQSALTGPLEGFLVDRLGPRRVVAIGVFIMGIGYMLFGSSHSILMYYLSSIVIALGTGLQGLLVMSVSVNNWFRRKRTIAQSVMGLGYSLAGVAGVPLLVLVQGNAGWRPSAVGFGVIVWVIGFPFAMLLKSTPEQHGHLPDGVAPGADIVISNNDAAISDEYDFTLKEAVRTKEFWLIAFASAISNLGVLGVQLFLFLHLEGHIGLARGTVTLVWTVASLCTIPSRLLGGVFGDRWPKNIILGWAVVLMAISVYVLAIAESALPAFIYAILFGIGWGIRTPVVNAIQAEYFGRKSQGIIRGWLQLISLPITIATPIVAGYLADVQGTYRPTFIGIAIVILAGAVMVFIASQPKPPVHKTSPYQG